MSDAHLRATDRKRPRKTPNKSTPVREGTGVELAQQYLIDRGLTPKTVAARFGVEIESPPDPRLFRERLGLDYPQGVQSILWVPVLSKAGAVVSRIARLLPTPDNWPKFLCAKSSGAPPWMMPELYDRKVDHPLVITEGPFKAMAITQAGYDAIGLNGVWCAASAKTNGDDPLTLRPELASLTWLGRKTYLAFDADLLIKPEVRQALIRIYLLLANAGADVYQLTTWPLEQGKGIDDYLAAQGTERIQKTFESLISAAKVFSQTLSATLLDAHLVQKELPRIQFGSLVLELLTKQLANALGVRVEELRNLASGPSKPKLELSFAASYEPWPDPVDGEELFNEIMVRIRKEAIIEHHQLWACALWVMFTWVHPQMEFSPILYIIAPTLECGKTSLLTVMGKMARRPLKTANASSASVYRLSELYHPTFLMDEAHDRLKDPDFWLVMKAGHTPEDFAVRCDPNSFEPRIFDVFCPKLLAAIGRANAQIMSRSIIIEMERREAKLERSTKASDPIFVQIRQKLSRWALDAGDLARFRLPEQADVKRRARDNWESLYRVACGVSSAVASQLLRYIPSFIDEEQDSATYLLNSLYRLYRDCGELTPEGFIGSEQICEELNKDKEAPWYTNDNKGLTVHGLAARLRRYKVKPDQVWQPDIEKDVRGYPYVDSRKNHNDLKRVFEQYLPPQDQP